VHATDVFSVSEFYTKESGGLENTQSTLNSNPLAGITAYTTPSYSSTTTSMFSLICIGLERFSVMLGKFWLGFV
jgi:hypothetical protein